MVRDADNDCHKDGLPTMRGADKIKYKFEPRFKYAVQNIYAGWMAKLDKDDPNKQIAGSRKQNAIHTDMHTSNLFYVPCMVFKKPSIHKSGRGVEPTDEHKRIIAEVRRTDIRGGERYKRGRRR